MDNFVDYHPSLDGIRGWLVALALFVILIPLVLIFAFGDDSWKILASSERWRDLTSDKTSPNYNPRWQIVILFNVMVFGILLLASLVQIYLFITHHHWFPRFFTGFMIAASAGVIASALVATQIDEVRNTRAGIYAWRLLLTVGFAALWIAYIRMSPRVRFTFLNR